MPRLTYTFGPWGVLTCDDMEYTCTDEQCNNSLSGNPGNCGCPLNLPRDCNCECGDPNGVLSDATTFAFLTDCGCNQGNSYHLGVCEEDCPVGGGTYCNYIPDSVNQCEEIDDDIEGSDIPKPSIQQRWVFQVSDFTPVDVDLSTVDLIYDSSNIFYADLIVDGELNPSNYRLYAVINNEIRGVVDITSSVISYYYFEVKWQQTQDLGQQINLYVENTDNNNFYEIDYIENPSGQPIDDISTLITSMSWYS